MMIYKCALPSKQSRPELIIRVAAKIFHNKQKCLMHGARASSQSIMRQKRILPLASRLSMYSWATMSIEYQLPNLITWFWQPFYTGMSIGEAGEWQLYNIEIGAYAAWIISNGAVAMKVLRRPLYWVSQTLMHAWNYVIDRALHSYIIINKCNK